MIEEVCRRAITWPISVGEYEYGFTQATRGSRVVHEVSLDGQLIGFIETVHHKQGWNSFTPDGHFVIWGGELDTLAMVLHARYNLSAKQFAEVEGGESS